MPNIADFLASVSAGVHRQYKYRVTVNFPSIVASNDVTRTASLLAKSTAVPESIIGEMVINWGGREIPLPGDRTFPEFTLSFINTNDFKVREAWEAWSELINGSESNTAGVIDPDDYMRDITLELLGPTDNVIKTYVLQNAWPKSVGQIGLDMTAMDSFSEYDVALRYINLASNVTR
uniref:Tail tube protein n=1 Tax=Pseudomonas phage Cygsa01 TaxID=3138529 RepID=A0AAU6W401_9VIRU